MKNSYNMFSNIKKKFIYNIYIFFKNSNNWTGSTCCDQGFVCQKLNDWYSQCVQSTGQNDYASNMVNDYSNQQQQQQPMFNEPVIATSKQIQTIITTKTVPMVVATKTVPTYGANTKTVPTYGANTKTVPTYGANTKTVPTYDANTKTVPTYGANTKTVPTYGANTKTVPTYEASKKLSTLANTKTIPTITATKTVPFKVETNQIPTVVPQQAAVANFPQQQAADGYASMNGGTTGGQGGQTVTVSSQSELEAALKGDTAKIVKVNGIIKLSSEVAVGSNSSIIGANANSGFTGAGLVIKNVKNIIIQNLKFSSCLGSNKDCINATKSTNIWVDHCEFYNDRNNGKDYYDGLVDFTHACDYITVSWCSLHDHYKASLVGHSDSNSSEDTGKLHITYHHNYFKNIGSRLPSLRFGTGHVYNNVYENIESSSVNIRMGAQALVESNVFKNAKKPISTNLDSKVEGSVIERNNDFGTTANTNSITKVASLTIPYQYTADNVKNIYNAVVKGAGPNGNGSSQASTSAPVSEPVVSNNNQWNNNNDQYGNWYGNTDNNNNNNNNNQPISSASSSQVIGYASMNGGTTGGQGGQTVTVSSQSELEAALKGDAAKIVKVNGIINLSSEVTINSNTSLVGANKNSGFTGAGVKFKNAKNIIIQNLKFSKCLGSNKDCINATKSTNIWVDHCEFYNDRNNGKDYYDGLVDFTHACDYITVSWCSLHDHYKASLVGHSDSNSSEDTGKLHITYHHNYFKNIGSRLPSLRFGTGHIFNNVYENIESSSINVRMGAQALVESNVFKNANKPISTNLDSKVEGSVIERNNDFGTTANTNSITKKGNLNSVPYKYTADNVKNIYNAVVKGAGPN